MVQSVELLLDKESDAAIRAQWDLLGDAELPTARRSGPSPHHAPHITLWAGQALSSETEEALRGLFGDLHLELVIGGVLLFGPRQSRYILVRQVVVSAALAALQRSVSDLCRGRVAPKYLENKLKFFPYIKEAVAFGQGRDRVGAFINIDMDAVANWAEKRNLSYSGYTDLASRDEVCALIRECVEKVNADLSQEAEIANSQIHRFLVLHKELDADDGELTRTRKVRRGAIGEKYSMLVEALYDGRSSVHVEAQVKYEDGRTGMLSADLKVCDVKTFPVAAVRKAA